MGRPLRQDVIEKMNLVASGKTLSAQVGYNKYKVKGSDEIVMLSTVEDLDKGYVVLKIDGKIVTKILRNLIQTVDEIIPYTIDENGKMVIDGKTVVEDVKEPSEPVVKTSKAKSKKVSE